MDIFALFRSFWHVHSTTVLRQLSAIIAGALCAPLHITMRTIARWSTCSYRTIQRFFATPIHWPSFHTALVVPHPTRLPLSPDETPLVHGSPYNAPFLL